MAKKLNDEELDKVVGGSHVDPDDISDYVGRDMTYSNGMFGWGDGPCSVHINSVNGTIVNLTFTNPDNTPSWATDSSKSLPNKSWKKMGFLTFEFDYGTTAWEWLE